MFLLLLHFGGTLALSLFFGLYLTPIIRNGAIKFGVLDHPDGKLKQHAEPVPYLGGIAVYLAFLLSLAVVFEFHAQLLGLLLGGTLIVMLGLFDDMRVLPPGLKLAGQLLAALVLIKSDIAIHLQVLPSWVSVPLSVLWLLTVTNAVNLLDVADGLATGTSVVAALALFAVAVIGGDGLIATITLALVGSMLGFLRFNHPPARIYLGDAGSLFLGFMLAALSMIGAYTEKSLVAALAPVFILLVPLLETALVSLARLRRGASPLRGSADHAALRLQRRGWSARRVALGGYVTSAIAAACGVAMVVSPAAVAKVTALVVSLVAFVLFVWLWRLQP